MTHLADPAFADTIKPGSFPPLMDSNKFRLVEMPHVSIEQLEALSLGVIKIGTTNSYNPVYGNTGILTMEFSSPYDGNVLLAMGVLNTSEYKGCNASYEITDGDDKVLATVRYRDVALHYLEFSNDTMASGEIMKIYASFSFTGVEFEIPQK
jgi:hypothetical protein